jgi:hypothetical protein
VAGPVARILSPSPDATNGVSCATRREEWVTGFDCGVGAALSYRRYPTDPVDSSLPTLCAGVLAVFLPRDLRYTYLTQSHD